MIVSSSIMQAVQDIRLEILREQKYKDYEDALIETEILTEILN